MLTVAICALLGAGCAEWPRYQHLPSSGDPDALVAGSDPSGAVSIDWGSTSVEVESGTDNGLPVDDVVAVSPGTGFIVSGTLSGAGWHTDVAPDRTGTCGSLAFPIGDDGSYAGDVDWLGVVIEAEGYLCATIEVDREGSRYDLVPYGLDDCVEPDAVLTDADGLPWGYGLDSPGASWAMPVDDGQRIGVALAAFWPQDTTTQIGWRIGLSMTASGLCPKLPVTQ